MGLVKHSAGVESIAKSLAGLFESLERVGLLRHSGREIQISYVQGINQEYLGRGKGRAK